MQENNWNFHKFLGMAGVQISQGSVRNSKKTSKPQDLQQTGPSPEF
jgi:hypothetical protein